jgi:hypothetical protein
LTPVTFAIELAVGERKPRPVSATAKTASSMFTAVAETVVSSTNAFMASASLSPMILDEAQCRFSAPKAILSPFS